MLTKPKMPWGNVEAARNSTAFDATANPYEFPCLACDGTGKRRMHLLSHNDPYCLVCYGAKTVVKKIFMEYYDGVMAGYELDLVIYRQKMETFRELTKHLSRDDLEILKECL